MLLDRYLCLVTLVYCGQTVGWVKMPLGMEVGLAPCHIVLHGGPAPHGKGYSSLHTLSRFTDAGMPASV